MISSARSPNSHASGFSSPGLCCSTVCARGGQTPSELCAGHAMSRQAVSKHLALLEAANLVVTVKRGREKLHYLNPVPIAEIARRWISKFEEAQVDALVDLKRKLESE